MNSIDLSWLGNEIKLIWLNGAGNGSIEGMNGAEGSWRNEMKTAASRMAHAEFCWGSGWRNKRSDVAGLPFLLLFFSFIKQHNSFFLSIKEVDWMKGRELFVFFFIGCCWLWAPLHLTRRELLSLIPLIQSTLLVHQSNLKRRRNKVNWNGNGRLEGEWKRKKWSRAEQQNL